jgi:hypothetical protein
VKLRLVETAAALLVACGFASLAEICLGRRSRNLLEWNESFVIGGGIAAALLFPLSMLSPRGALDAVLVLLALAAGGVSARMLIFRSNATVQWEPARSNDRWRPAALILAALVAAAAAAFWLLDLRTAFAWDGFQTWGTKAYLLYRDRGLRPEMWPGSQNEARSGRTVSYPNLVPLYETLVAVLRGRFEFLGVKPVFLVFYLSMLVSTYRGGKALNSERHDSPKPHASPRGPTPPLHRVERGFQNERSPEAKTWALAAVALLALLPTFTARQSVGGNADLPEAAVVAALAAAWLAENPRAGRWSSSVPWLLGALLMVKSEGGILFGVACLSAALLGIRADVLSKVRRNAGGLAVGATLLAGRFLYLHWTTVPETTYGPIDAAHLAQALERLGLVTRLCLRELGDFSQWGLFWPAFVLSAIACLRWGNHRQKVLALAAAMGVAAYSGIFLFTNWPVELQVQQAYRRLLTQIVPAAVLTLVAAYRALRNSRAAEPDLVADPQPANPAR